MDARTRAIESIRPLCKYMGDRIAQKSGGVFDADDSSSDLVIGAIKCYDNIDPADFEDEAQIQSAVANAVHRDYQDMLRKATNVVPDEAMTTAGNLNRAARGSLRMAKDAATVTSPPVDIPLQLDMDAMLESMDSIDEEICRRLQDGESKAEIGRQLELTPSQVDSRIASIRHQMRKFNEV
jgi:DNA-directed RNA polymerase specialized sigma24 family protein